MSFNMASPHTMWWSLSCRAVNLSNFSRHGPHNTTHSARPGSFEAGPTRAGWRHAGEVQTRCCPMRPARSAAAFAATASGNEFEMSLILEALSLARPYRPPPFVHLGKYGAFKCVADILLVPGSLDFWFWLRGERGGRPIARISDALHSDTHPLRSAARFCECPVSAKSKTHKK